MEFIHLPVPLEVVVRRNDGPGSRRMRSCQISYAFHPEPSVGAIARAESGACAFGDCLFDVGSCSTGPWYALSASSQCVAVQNARSTATDKRCTRRETRVLIGRSGLRPYRDRAALLAAQVMLRVEFLEAAARHVSVDLSS